MSKPSITNCPNTFFMKVHSFNCIFSSLSCFACVQIRHTPLSGGYCGEVPPLPIPNREVKPACADGTAMQCGRVGGCLLYLRSSRSNDFGDLFYVLILIVCKDTKKNRIMQVIGWLSAHFYVIKHLVTLRFDINQYKGKKGKRSCEELWEKAGR